MIQPLIEIIIQYRWDSIAQRREEYNYCVGRNLQNPWIGRVHCLSEEGEQIPSEFRNHSKFLIHTIDSWLTYKQAFEFAEASLSPDVLACLCNLDIFLDDSGTDWAKANELVQKNIVLCLARHDFDHTSGRVSLDAAFCRQGFYFTQDAWLFRPGMKVANCNFHLGMLGCDNAIAERISESGYIPLNAMQQYRIFHVDVCRGKHSVNQGDVHVGESKAGKRPENTHPERLAQLPLPDFDRIRDIDGFLASLGVSEVRRYQEYCRLMSRIFKIENPD